MLPFLLNWAIFLGRRFMDARAFSDDVFLCFSISYASSLLLDVVFPPAAMMCFLLPVMRKNDEYTITTMSAFALFCVASVPMLPFLS